MGWGRLEQAAQLAARNPDTSIVIDHLGLQQPFEPPPPAQPFADLPKVLELAAHPNVAIKISGACTLSHEAVPLQGHLGAARAHLRRLRPRPLPVGHRLDAGDRAADVPAGRRAFRVTDRLSESDERTLMGGTLQRVYKWSPKRP